MMRMVIKRTVTVQTVRRSGALPSERRERFRRRNTARLRAKTGCYAQQTTLLGVQDSYNRKSARTGETRIS